jgi:GMP synthase (glutamine-hydrolysing)
LKRALILDTSTDRSETALTARWVPEGVPVDALFIEDAASFPDDLLDRGHTHVIHTGSAYSINDVMPFTDRLAWHVGRYAERGVAQMGICYGHQVLCRALVGPDAVRRNPKGLDAGWRGVRFTDLGRELLGLRRGEVVWQSHFDEVVEMPPGSELLATSDTTRVESFLHERLKLLGTQFHPEFDEEKGNAQFAKERALFEGHGLDVDAMIRGRPSFDTGRVMVGFFLEHFD